MTLRRLARHPALASCFGLIALLACGDPETGDDRGYTKAPLENPGLMIDGEEASEMDRLGDPRLVEPEVIRLEDLETPAAPAPQPAAPATPGGN